MLGPPVRKNAGRKFAAPRPGRSVPLPGSVELDAEDLELVASVSGGSDGSGRYAVEFYDVRDAVRFAERLGAAQRGAARGDVTPPPGLMPPPGLDTAVDVGGSAEGPRSALVWGVMRWVGSGCPSGGSSGVAAGGHVMGTPRRVARVAQVTQATVGCPWLARHAMQTSVALDTPVAYDSNLRWHQLGLRRCSPSVPGPMGRHWPPIKRRSAKQLADAWSVVGLNSSADGAEQRPHTRPGGVPAHTLWPSDPCARESQHQHM